MLMLLAVIAIMVVVTGPMAETVGQLIGLGDAAVTAWDIAKWPVLVRSSASCSRSCTGRPRTSVSRGSAGSRPAGSWQCSCGSSPRPPSRFYVANFGSYNKTYGTLGGVITFLVWMWISNIAVLLGAEFDAELERERELEAGRDPDEEPFLEPRDTASSTGEPATRLREPPGGRL